MAYTYDDFVNAANKAGLMNEFSSYDLDIAREHPEFGLSMLTLKQDIHAATTQEAKKTPCGKQHLTLRTPQTAKKYCMISIR